MTEEKKPNILKLRKIDQSAPKSAEKPIQKVEIERKIEEPKQAASVEVAPPKAAVEERPADKTSVFSNSPALKGMPQIIERTSTFERKPRPFNNRFDQNQRPQGQFQDRRFPDNQDRRMPGGAYEKRNMGDDNRPPRPEGYKPRFENNPDRPFRPRYNNPDRPEGQRPYTPRPYNQEGQRPYTPRPYNPEGQKSYTPGSRPYTPRPYTPGERRPYTPGSRPYTPGGQRPYTPGGQRPYTPGGQRPYTSGGGPTDRRPFNPGPGFENKSSLFEDKKKKKNIDRDDRVKDYKFKDDNNINTTTFVGRVDASHLENHDWDTFGGRRNKDFNRGKAQSNVQFIKKDIEIPGPLSIKEIAAKMAMQVRDVLAVAKKAGLSANERENFEPDILHIIVEACGHTPIRIDEQTKAQLELPKQFLNPKTAKPRPPVVVVVGHVDHGKTSLLDAIRKTKMVNKEAGGITQSIGAYQVATKDGKITFIDTPGHEAFTAIRSRGVTVTDIAILVVSAGDSVKPQTIEAIAHVKAANVPMIVAITKCDLHTANPDKVKHDLLQHEIVVGEYGVPCVEVSAHTGKNLDLLLKEILVQAEVMELKANLDVEARGIVLESRLNPKIGVLTTVLVMQGVLKPQSFCIADTASGNIKAINDDTGARVKEALSGTPVEIVGMDIPASAGSEFAVIKDLKVAADILKARKEKHEHVSKKPGMVFDIENFQQESIPNINLILRADTQGALEALKFAVDKLNNEKSEAKAVLSSIGPAKEGDVNLATISGATIVCFNTKTPSEIKQMAEREGIAIIEDPIIYNIIDAIEAKLLGLIKPEEKETFVGSAKVQQIFSSSKLGNIAGCIVANGVMRRDLIAKVVRNERVIATTKISSLKRNKDDAKEVSNGLECGIVLNNFNDFQIGDEIHCFKLEYV